MIDDVQDEVIVTRAPGRLDVMGGIGDYSGCLVLQKPTAEACHVACQRQPVPKQKLWKHVENRHKLKGGENSRNDGVKSVLHCVLL